MSGPGRLLIVDDVSDNRDLLRRRFERLGYTCAEAADGEAALALIFSEPFDLVLLDVMMPGIDGLETLKRIRERLSPDDLPVVMATAKTTNEDVVAALELGANDYVVKPIDMAVVRARVTANIDRKRALDTSRTAQAELERTVERLSAAMTEAEAASKAKSQFLANMSHEIRTPLNGILGMATVLRQGCSPEQAEMLKDIADSACRLERLLSDVLDAARIEAGALRLQQAPFDLGEMLEQAVRPFEAAAAEKGVALNLLISPEARVRVMSDAGRLKQIVENLLSNAVKFTAEGRIDCTALADAEAVGIEVRDTGIGFDPALSEAIFDRFRQIDGSDTRRHGGSGLGLSISRDLAQMMGGALTADGRPGAGAVFRLSLPHAGEAGLAAPAQPTVTPPPPAAPAPAAAPAAQRRRVLQADDNPVNRKVVELILGASDFDVISVENGAEAVKAAAAEAFDLILMDIQMPVMDGLTAIREIRAQGQSSAPILVLSANAAPRDMVLSQAAGADGHLGKPIDAAALLMSIAEVLAAPDEPAAEAQA